AAPPRAARPRRDGPAGSEDGPGPVPVRRRPETAARRHGGRSHLLTRPRGRHRTADLHRRRDCRARDLRADQRGRARARRRTGAAGLGHRYHLRQRLRLPGMARRPDVLRRSRRPRSDPRARRGVSSRARRSLEAGAAARAPGAIGRYVQESRQPELSNAMQVRSEALADARVLPADIVVTRDADGTIRARSPHPLGPYPERITDRLDYWAGATPHRPFLAQKTADGCWRYLTYADARRRALRLAQAFIDRQLSADRPIVILSGNSIEHALVALGAMYCGVLYAPAAPAYSLLVRDRTTLRRLVGMMTPGLVFADDGALFAPALADIADGSFEVVTVTPAPSIATTPLSALEATEPTSAVEDARLKVDGDTIAKVLFTSGSTGRPKGVINTQRMLCANQEQLRTVLAFLADAPPVLCDWLPWNHTFGGNHNFGIALYNGGTLYIDDGRPVPGQMERTIENLRSVTTTAYFNVPRGFEMLLPALRADAALRRQFFSRLQALFFAAAGLRPEIADGLQELAVATVGRPIPWITGLGATESAPFALCTGALLSTTTHVGVPVPGLELKAAPVGDLLEARLRGPNITPGYWRDDEATRAAFDEE